MEENTLGLIKKELLSMAKCGIRFISPYHGKKIFLLIFNRHWLSDHAPVSLNNKVRPSPKCSYLIKIWLALPGFKEFVHMLWNTSQVDGDAALYCF